MSKVIEYFIPNDIIRIDESSCPNELKEKPEAQFSSESSVNYLVEDLDYNFVVLRSYHVKDYGMMLECTPDDDTKDFFSLTDNKIVYIHEKDAIIITPAEFEVVK